MQSVKEIEAAIESLGCPPTPYFLLSLNDIREKYERIVGALPCVSIHYAVKANNHPRVVSTLMALGCGFEIASFNEALPLIEMGVSASDLYFSSPVKLPDDIMRAHAHGIKHFAFDSESEIEKLKKYAPQCRIFLRLRVGNTGSMFPLNTKFGAAPDQAVMLLQEAERAGLEPWGASFHVGSQCVRMETWKEALDCVMGIFEELSGAGIALKCLNIGGGFPVAYLGSEPTVEEIGAYISSELEGFSREGITIMAEPGRYLVASSGTLVTTVIGHARRGSDDWLFVDASALHGLFEAVQKNKEFPYKVDVNRSGRNKKYVVSGPTCDPDDTLFKEVWLPELQCGDTIYIRNAGAYSFVYSTHFHGFPKPEIFVTE